MKLNAELIGTIVQTTGLDSYRTSEFGEVITKGFERLLGAPGHATFEADVMRLTLDIPEELIVQILLTYALDVDGPLQPEIG